MIIDQWYRTDVDAGLMQQTNGKTNNAGLTFLQYSGIPVFLIFNLFNKKKLAKIWNITMLQSNFT
jgi:hypothetical protein